MKRKAFTLMEIIVSLIILASVFGGLTATFLGVKRYVARASRRLVAVNLGRQVLNALNVYVRADTWVPNTGPLQSSAAPGVTHNCVVGEVQVPDSITIDNFTYGDAAHPNNYVVRDVAGRQYREVTVTIWYPTN